MKPFKFFFALSIGIMLFLFFAKVVLMALVAAAFMTIVFGIFRKAKHFFKDLLWEDYEEQDQWNRYGERILPAMKEDFFSDRPNTSKVYLSHHRRIIVQ